MMKSPFRERSRSPSLHASSCDRNPVDPARGVGNITAHIFKALTPKKLAPAGDVVLTFETIFGCVVPATFGKRSAAHPKARILGKFLHQKLQIVGRKGKVSIEVADDTEI